MKDLADVIKYLEAEYLHAEEVLEEVDTLGIVLARVGVTISDILLTMHSSPARRTRANKCSNLITASSTVHARAGGAIIDVGLTGLTHESLAALALKLVVQIKAAGGASGIAKVGGALINGCLASQANKARAAVTDERVFGI